MTSQQGQSGVTPGAEPAPAAPQQFQPNEKTWALFAHLSALSIFVAIPFGDILGPLIIWLVKKDTMPFVNDQGKESLNFQLSVLIYGIVAGILCFVLIGIPLLIALGIFDLVMVIIATVKASNGVAYRYPLCIRFIK